MGINFKCLKCYSFIEVTFDSNKNTTQRIFYDQKSITKRETDNYLWGGEYHPCPLLQCSHQKDFDKLIAEGKIERLITERDSANL